jgi:hypothetical protein
MARLLGALAASIDTSTALLLDLFVTLHNKNILHVSFAAQRLGE